MPPSSGLKVYQALRDVDFLLGLPFIPEDGGDMFPQLVG
jgi:hypothetical protein